MKFVIITHACHKKSEKSLFSYAPYVREINLWLKHVDAVQIIAPKNIGSPTPIEIAYKHNNIAYCEVPAIQFTSIVFILKSIFLLPSIVYEIFRACKNADHIHLRCPGNMGLLGCFVQVFFPKKTKTAKYAGNWDPKAKQPLSYRIQKWILSNTFLTKNIQVLVYGDWPNQSKNITSFFTASYYASEICKREIIKFKAPFHFLFVGSLVEGKRPLYAIQLVEQLIKNGIFGSLKIYGDGIKRQELETYVVKNKLQENIFFMGNQNSKIIKTAFQESDFVLLPSKSEGWPKVLAEAMFWGVIPIATPISCVPWMLGFGDRGILLDLNIEKDSMMVAKFLSNRDALNLMSEKAMQWSQKYTLDFFEDEIKKLF